MRRLTLTVRFNTGTADQTPHIFFDTRAALQGAPKPEHAYNLNWVDHNALHTSAKSA